MTGSETHLGACRIAGPDACRRILLCGEDNPLSSDPRYALYHQPPRCAGHRLQSYILGVDQRRTYLPIWRTNLCTGGWDRTAAVDRAEQLIGDAPWDIIVALGAKVGDAFRRVCRFDLQPFSSQEFGVPGSGRRVTIVSLPHPSGRNAATYTQARIAIARTLMKTVAPGVPWGELDTELPA